MKKHIYLDNAATSFPKPECVMKAFIESLTTRGGNPGRAGHYYSAGAGNDVYRLRENAADFFGCSHPENVIITHGDTESLNIALKMTAESGMTVLTSDIEHNSLRRPLIAVEKTRNVAVRKFETSDDRSATLLSFRAAVGKYKPDIVALNHSSNVISRVLPLGEIAAECRKNGILLIVDAAQSAGHCDIRFDEYGIDALCIPGHKGLFSPIGIGLLIVSERFIAMSEKMPTLYEGGAGSASFSGSMPPELPERFEPGSVSSCLCAALSAGIDFVRKTGMKTIYGYEKSLTHYARERLMNIGNVKIYGKNDGSVLSFSHSGIDSETFSGMLDHDGICLRGGFHCSADVHRAIGSEKSGTVRLSPSVFNTVRDIDMFISAVRKNSQRS